METIEFAIYLTGHDKETIEQMYSDWVKHKKYDSNNVFDEMFKNPIAEIENFLK